MTEAPPKPQNKILLSGMQPTGNSLMLGNFLGAMKNWLKLQDQYSCYFCVVDMHSLTIRQDPAALREQCYAMVASYLASGIDPHKSLVFMQSHVPEHAELGWVMTCHSYMGELSRMTQFKDKSSKNQNVPTGIFVYPALMAADILLYQAGLVPVGADQKQHMELARDLAIRMNNLYQRTLFAVPEVYIAPQGARIMSLQNPEKKMSKSDEDAAATVFMTDSDETIAKKFKRAVTDSVGVINYTDEQPGVRNLIDIQAAISDQTAAEILATLEGKQYGFLKTQTADMAIELIRPIREETNRLLADKPFLHKILSQSAAQARAVASVTMKNVYDAIGLPKA